jgi:nucleotide-binding universal stress UspA family protein
MPARLRGLFRACLHRSATLSKLCFPLRQVLLPGAGFYGKDPHMKILLAVDGSAFTSKMLDYLGAHSQLFGSGNQYTALTVRPKLLGRAGSYVGKDAVDDYHADEAAAVLDPVKDRLALAGIEAETRWKVGEVGEAIAETASEGGYDLIVMGSHGHSALGNLVMGSAANKVMTESRVPVLLIR